MCNSDLGKHSFVDKTTVKNKLQEFNKLLDISRKEKRPLVLWFKADWCGHCKIVEPIFAKYRNKCVQNNSDLIMVIANLDTAKELFEHHKIDGFPVIKFFDSGKEIKEQEIQGSKKEEIENLLNRLTSKKKF